MRKRIDAYILLDFLEGWRTRLKNEQIIALNGIWAAKVEQSIKDLSTIINFVKANSKAYDNDKKRPTEINEQTIEADRLRKISAIMATLKQAADLAGLEVVGRVIFKDKATGKEYR